MDIFRAFEKSMVEYVGIQKSRHWQKFDKRKHLFKEENLANFRNNQLSEGLDDQYSPAEQKEIFDELVREVGENYVLANLTDKNIGNSEQFFKIGEKFVDGGQNFHIKWLRDLEQYVFSKRNVRFVCEIGGGYGSFVQKISARHKATYVLIDLPEANVLASYYLSKHFPDAKFLLCDQIEGRSVTCEQVEKFDFVIIPPWYTIEDVKFDLVINTRSMMEMNFKVIAQYFDFIQSHIAEGGFFFNINRYRKASVGYPIELSKYPYDEKWNVVYSKPSWRQNHIHELITERISGRGNIAEELSRIDEISRKMHQDIHQNFFQKSYMKLRSVVNRFRYQRP